MVFKLKKHAICHSKAKTLYKHKGNQKFKKIYVKKMCKSYKKTMKSFQKLAALQCSKTDQIYRYVAFIGKNIYFDKFEYAVLYRNHKLIVNRP